MVNYLKYERQVFHKRHGEGIRSKEKDLFLLGKDRQGPKGQKNAHGKLSLLDRGRYQKAKKDNR